MHNFANHKFLHIQKAKGRVRPPLKPQNAAPARPAVKRSVSILKKAPRSDQGPKKSTARKSGNENRPPAQAKPKPAVCPDPVLKPDSFDFAKLSPPSKEVSYC